MIDDSGAKFSWFEPIVKACDQILRGRGSPICILAPQLGDCITRPPLTVDDCKRLAVNSITAPEVWKAIQDDIGIYMLDLQIPEVRIPETQQMITPQQFISMFEHGEAPGLETARALAQLPKLGSDEKLALDKPVYRVAVAVAAYLRATRKPFWLITSDAPGGDQKRFRRAFDLPQREPFPDMWFSDSDEDLTTAHEHALTLISLLDPLQMVQAVTARWFSTDLGDKHDYIAAGLPHGWNEDRADDHKACVKRLWGWAPDNWWNKTNASAFHECLKNSFGHHAGWMGNKADRPLTLAGCYLLFLLAAEQKAQSEIRRFLIDDWTVFCLDGKPVPFLNHQERPLAEATVRALFDFFLEIVSHRDHQNRLGVDGWAPPTREARHFGLHVSWDELGRNQFAVKVNQRLRGIAQCGPTELYESKATAHFLRFMLLSQGALHGAGSPSGIWFADDPDGFDDERGWLWIGRQG
jgi:hypothetical protein